MALSLPLMRSTTFLFYEKKKILASMYLTNFMESIIHPGREDIASLTLGGRSTPKFKFGNM
jgi:hypothetical protein